MQAGKLSHRICPQKRVSSQNAETGEVVTEWINIASSTSDGCIWGEVTAVSARDFVAAQAFQNAVTARIKIRFRDDITAKCRILFRGKIYNIEGVLPDPDSGLEYLTLPCSEGTNDG